MRRGRLGRREGRRGRRGVMLRTAERAKCEGKEERGGALYQKHGHIKKLKVVK